MRNMTITNCLCECMHSKQYIILQNMQEILVHYIDNQYVTTILETKLLHNL